MAIGAYIHGTPIRRKRQLVCRVVAEQAVAVPIGGDPADQGSVYTFNESGTTLWTMIEAGGSIARSPVQPKTRTTLRELTMAPADRRRAKGPGKML